MKNDLQITTHDFLIYRDDNNDVKVNVLLINNDIWLTQNLIAELFGVGRSTVTEHINNILKDGELREETSVGISDKSTGGRKSKIYNLDMIIAVGYRVNSKKATNFRIWATKILKEYLITGVAMDDERLKNPNYIFGEDYFERTLERIRNIRSSERRFYQKITDIYSSCSVDYDKDSEITKTFFKTVQNKLHYSVTGNTAAEIIYNRVDLDKDKLNINDYDALYLNGGEPKNLMTSIINSNNYQIIKDFIDNGGIIIGQSAGAMIFNKEYLDTTTGNLLIMDNGFDYYNKIIVPHYNNLPSELLSKIPNNILKINDDDNLYKLDI